VATWDPAVYRQFSEERSRPFDELVRRIPTAAPRRVVDLGCGSGELTLELARRWPDAEVEGIDSSPAMIADARALDGPVRFREGDAARWSDPAADVIVSNACLHWLPDHRALIGAWGVALPPDGAIAVQMPLNDRSPAHRALHGLAASPRWSPQLAGVLRPPGAVAEPEEYAAVLAGAGLWPDVWETTYLHRLTGPDPVLEWLRGTAMRPALAVLDPSETADFEAELGAALREAYPAPDGVTTLGYRRVFMIGHRG
jgi:trans-aconitate 2-methyltransferase